MIPNILEILTKGKGLVLVCPKPLKWRLNLRKQDL